MAGCSSQVHRTLTGQLSGDHVSMQSSSRPSHVRRQQIRLADSRPRRAERSRSRSRVSFTQQMHSPSVRPSVRLLTRSLLASAAGRAGVTIRSVVSIVIIARKTSSDTPRAAYDAQLSLSDAHRRLILNECRLIFPKSFEF